jgi:hypothetical protein
MLLYVNFLFPWTWIFFQNAFATLTFYINAFVVFALFAFASVLKFTLHSVARHAEVTKPHP